jgi:hypothetical protein
VLSLKRYVSVALDRHAIRTHRSRVGWRQAPIYSRYLQRCHREAPAHIVPSKLIADAAETFRAEGITGFRSERTAEIVRKISTRMAAYDREGKIVWTARENGYFSYLGDPWLDHPEFEQLFKGELGDFLHSYYRSAFKILYGSLYRTEHYADRTGSQLWHSDSGPGTCVNVMFYLSDVTPDHGALEGLPWKYSLEIFEQEKRISARGQLDLGGRANRDRICEFYDQAIAARYRDKIRQPTGPAGLVVPFLNNLIHRGGYPAAGLQRTAIVFHCYPSHRPTDIEKYRIKGIRKTAPYPKDPAEDF